MLVLARQNGGRRDCVAGHHRLSALPRSPILGHTVGQTGHQLGQFFRQLSRIHDQDPVYIGLFDEALGDQARGQERLDLGGAGCWHGVTLKTRIFDEKYAFWLLFQGLLFYPSETMTSFLSFLDFLLSRSAKLTFWL